MYKYSNNKNNKNEIGAHKKWVQFSLFIISEKKRQGMDESMKTLYRKEIV